jgi:hypothetical protein
MFYRKYVNSWFLHLLTIITTLQKYGIKISWQICFNNSFYIVYITVVEFTGTQVYRVEPTIKSFIGEEAVNGEQRQSKHSPIQ